MRSKAELREELTGKWKELWGTDDDLFRPPVFAGDGKAAEILRRSPLWIKARTVAVMADPVLLQVRINALADGKSLIAATPGLKKGLVRVTPDMVPVPRRNRDLRGGMLAQVGNVLRFPDARLKKVDLMVVAGIALDSRGFVLGDGRGLADLAFGLMRTLGAMDRNGPIAAVCAEEQILPQPLPTDPWDAALNLCATPQGLRHFKDPARPAKAVGSLPPHLARLPVAMAVLSGVFS